MPPGAASPVLTRQPEMIRGGKLIPLKKPFLPLFRYTHIAAGPTAPTWPFVLEWQNVQVLPHWRLVRKCSLLEESMWRQTREPCAETPQEPTVSSVFWRGPPAALTVHRAASISWANAGLSVNEVWQQPPCF